MVLNVFAGIIFDVTCFRPVSELNEVPCPITHGVCLYRPWAAPFPPSLGGSWVAGWGILFSLLHKGEKDQLTKDKKWTVNTLNKAQQEQELAFSLSLSLTPSSVLSTYHKREAQGLQSANYHRKFGPCASLPELLTAMVFGLIQRACEELQFSSFGSPSSSISPSLSFLIPNSIPLFCLQWSGFTVQCTLKGWYKMTLQRISFGEEQIFTKVEIAIWGGWSKDSNLWKNLDMNETSDCVACCWEMSFNCSKVTECSKIIP